MFTSCLEISSSVLDSSQSCCRREALNQSEGKVMHTITGVSVTVQISSCVGSPTLLPKPQWLGIGLPCFSAESIVFTSCLEISSSVLDSSQSCCRREALNQSEGKVIYIFLFVFIYIYISIFGLIYIGFCPRPVKDLPFGLIGASYYPPFGTVTGCGQFPRYTHQTTMVTVTFSSLHSDPT